MTPKKILNANEISTILHRLSFQLIEDHHDFSDTVIIAIQPRGVLLAERIVNFLIKESFKVQFGLLDITFYRDDFRRNEKVLKANKTILDFSIENKTVVLIDDVLYTDYCGIQVDSRLNQKVKVNWKEHDGEDSVYLFKNKE